MVGQETILWVEDDIGHVRLYSEYLTDSGYSVEIAATADEALSKIQRAKFDVAILDLMIPSSADMSSEETRGGHRTGIALARRLKQADPDIKLIGHSIFDDSETRQWFRDFGTGFIPKSEKHKPGDFVARLRAVVSGAKPRPRCFIVHGHDGVAKKDLKDLLQNYFKLSEPIILEEQASRGKTFIEKFESHAGEVGLVFVLLTPDDEFGNPGDSRDSLRRARQNVIFELGYFLGKLNRKTGRVLLLHKGPIDLPSDISGIAYVDISEGVSSAVVDIQREIESFI